MRITYGMSAANSLRNIELNQERMAAVEAQLTSGARIAKPSDDPIGAAQAMGFQQSIEATQGTETADTQRAGERTGQDANRTLSPADRAAIQLEVSQHQQSLLD